MNIQSKYAEQFLQAKKALELQREEEARLATLEAEDNRKQTTEKQQAYLKRYNQSNYAKSDQDKSVNY